jgi:hypothetical protein
MDEKIVFFEELRPVYLLLARWYLWRGYTVYYRQLSDACAHHPWIVKTQGSGRILRMTFDPPLYVGHNESSNLALDHVDQVYERYARLPAVRRVARLYDDDSFHLALKKIVLQWLS